MWTRDYAFKFNLTRNLVVDFHATTQARIDEPEGIVDRQRDPERYQQWKDTVWNNILDGGRPVNYNHDFSVQYTVPVNNLDVYKRQRFVYCLISDSNGDCC